MITVTLYSKSGCCLCDDAQAVIERVRSQSRFDVVIKDICDDARDFANYQFAIPVVTVNGREIARYRLDEQTLQTALHAAATE